MDVELDGRDAIQVLLEHADPAAPALAVALPYTRRIWPGASSDL